MPRGTCKLTNYLYSLSDLNWFLYESKKRERNLEVKPICSLKSFSVPNLETQPSLLKGMTWTMGVPAGISPSNFGSVKTKIILTGGLYLSVSTIAGNAEKGDSLWNGWTNKEE